MPRATLSVAEVFRRYGDDFRAELGAALSTAQRRVMTAIEQCRTTCGPPSTSTSSSPCPRRSPRSPPTTRPSSTVSSSRPSPTRCARIAADPRHLGAEIGYFAVLHTWGQTLVHHRHRRPAPLQPPRRLRALSIHRLPTHRGGPPESHDPVGDRIPSAACSSTCSRPASTRLLSKSRSGYRIGRPLEKPAAHLILSFHRSEIAVDEVHTRKAEIVKTARSALRALGLEDRQAVIVAHTGHVRQVGQHPRLTEDPREPDDRPVRRPSRGRLVAGEAFARRRRPRTTYRRKPASAPRRRCRGRRGCCSSRCC